MNTEQLLSSQDITQPHSATVGFDLSRTEFNSTTKIDKGAIYESTRLSKIQSMLEFSYGYRFDEHKNRYRRAAASAGAMYPIKIMILVNLTEYHVLLEYDFIEHCFRLCKAFHHTDIGSQQLSCSDSRVSIILCANFHQTMQRYGLRGYRYCNIDAGHIICNMVSFSHGKVSISQEYNGLSSFISPFLGDHSILTVLETMPEALPQHTMNWPKGTVSPPKPFVFQHPYLSSNLTEITTIHDDYLTKAYEVESNPTDIANELNTDACRLIWQRASSNNFTGNTLSYSLFEHYLSLIERCKLLYKTSLDIHCRFIISGIEGLSSGAYSYNMASKALHKVSSTSMNVSEALFLSCQSQELVKNASFAIIFCIKKDQQMDSLDTAPLLMNIGYLDACLQGLSTHLNVGNSSIGGFSDSCIKLIFGDSELQPLFMHVFGEGVDDITKFDAQYCESEEKGREKV